MNPGAESSRVGEAARRAFWRNHSESERFDIGLRYQSDVIESFLAQVPVPEHASPEERARIHFKALRRAKRDADL